MTLGVSSRALFPSVDVWWELGDRSLQSSGTRVQEAPSLWLSWGQCTDLHQVGVGKFLVAARPPLCWACLTKSEFFVVLLPGNREQLVTEHLFSREGWVAVFYEQNLFPSLLFVLVSLIPSQSLVGAGGVGSSMPERHPGFSQMLPCDMCMDLSSPWTSLLSLSCIHSKINPENNFYCRTDGKRKEMRWSVW